MIFDIFTAADPFLLAFTGLLIVSIGALWAQDVALTLRGA
jgi:hypothetical protein